MVIEDRRLSWYSRLATIVRTTESRKWRACSPSLKFDVPLCLRIARAFGHASISRNLRDDRTRRRPLRHDHRQSARRVSRGSPRICYAVWLRPSTRNGVSVVCASEEQIPSAFCSAAAPSAIADMAAALNEFGLGLFKALCAEAPAANVVLSPLSLKTCLSMVAAGATEGSASQQEMAKVLGSIAPVVADKDSGTLCRGASPHRVRESCLDHSLAEKGWSTYVLCAAAVSELPTAEVCARQTPRIVAVCECCPRRGFDCSSEFHFCEGEVVDLHGLPGMKAPPRDSSPLSCR